MNEKELNASKLIADIMLAIPQVMACVKNEDNKALATTIRAILDDLTSDPNPTKLGDGAILEMLMKLMPFIMQLIGLFTKQEKSKLGDGKILAFLMKLLPLILPLFMEPKPE